MDKKIAQGAIFLSITVSEPDENEVRPDDEASKNQELAHDFLSEKERKAFALAKA